MLTDAELGKKVRGILYGKLGPDAQLRELHLLQPQCEPLKEEPEPKPKPEPKPAEEEELEAPRKKVARKATPKKE